MKRRRFISVLAALPFFRFATKAKTTTPDVHGIYHDGTYCDVCSGLSALIHKTGPWSPDAYGRIKNNIANAIIEAKEPDQSIRAMAGNLRIILGHPGVQKSLAEQGLKVDYEQIVAMMSDHEWRPAFAPLFTPSRL